MTLCNAVCFWLLAYLWGQRGPQQKKNGFCPLGSDLIAVVGQKSERTESEIAGEEA